MKSDKGKINKLKNLIDICASAYHLFKLFIDDDDDDDVSRKCLFHLR